MSRLAILILSAYLLVACTQSDINTSMITLEPSLCSEWVGQGAEIVCYVVDDTRLLFQTVDEQVTISRLNISIVVDGTILTTFSDNMLTVTTLEGRSVLGLNGRTQILTQGQSIDIELLNGEAISLSNTTFITPEIIENLPLSVLPRAIDNGTLIIEPTLTPSPIPTLAINSDNCAPPQNWNRIYSVQAGDTLAQIANRYNVPVDDLIDANCITNAQRINIGQELFVPATGAVNNDAVNNSLSFRADDYSIRAGDCTVLRWDFTNIAGAYINDTLLSENLLQVCPDETTTYTLRIVGLDDSERLRDLTITVLE